MELRFHNTYTFKNFNTLKKQMLLILFKFHFQCSGIKIKTKIIFVMKEVMFRDV